MMNDLICTIGFPAIIFLLGYIIMDIYHIKKKLDDLGYVHINFGGCDDDDE